MANGNATKKAAGKKPGRPPGKTKNKPGPKPGSQVAKKAANQKANGLASDEIVLHLTVKIKMSEDGGLAATMQNIDEMVKAAKTWGDVTGDITVPSDAFQIS